MYLQKIHRLFYTCMALLHFDLPFLTPTLIIFAFLMVTTAFSFMEVETHIQLYIIKLLGPLLTCRKAVLNHLGYLYADF